jgi:hypothetical protein
VERGFSVERTFLKKGEDGVLKPIAGQVTVGEDIFSSVTVKPQSNSYTQYILIEDPLPSGFEAVDKDDFRGVSGVEVKDDRVALFVTRLDEKGITIVHRIRPERPGRFNVRSASAELMYYPSVRGYSDSMKVEVTQN